MFLCSSSERSHVKLLGGLQPLVLSLHGLGCWSPPISLVGWAQICRSGLTPFSFPLGLLLTHILYFFWHVLVLLSFFGHGPMVSSRGLCPIGGV